jgi:hypothetical protein
MVLCRPEDEENERLEARARRRRQLFGYLAGFAMLAVVPEVDAAPIAPGSQLSLLGTDIWTPTSVEFVGNAGIGSGSGSFASLATCTACVTVNDFNSSSTNFVLFEDPDTKLTLSSVSFIADPAAETLTVTGAGSLWLAGYTPDTPGLVTLTTQGPGDTEVTFSATATTVAIATPEPSTLWLAGPVIGLAMLLSYFGANRVRGEDRSAA